LSQYEDHLECNKCHYKFHKNCYKEDLKEALFFDEEQLSTDFDLKSDDFLCQECEWCCEDKQKKSLEMQEKLLAELTHLKKKSIIFRFNFDLVKIILVSNLKNSDKFVNFESDINSLIQEFLNENTEYFEGKDYDQFLKNLKVINKFNSLPFSKNKKKKLDEQQNFEEKDFELVLEMQRHKANGTFRHFNGLQDLFFGFRYVFSCTQPELNIPLIFHDSPWKFEIRIEELLDRNVTCKFLQQGKFDFLKEFSVYLSDIKFKDLKLNLRNFTEVFKDLIGEKTLINFQELKFGVVMLKEEIKVVSFDCYEEDEEKAFFMSKPNRQNSNILIQKNHGTFYNPFIIYEKEGCEVKNIEKAKKQELDELLEYENKSNIFS